jgi:hypothetical protein
LWLHSGTGQWMKKITGRMFYFGTDKDAALAEYTRCREALEAGLERPSKPDDTAGDRLTVKTLCNAFLTHKKSAVAIGKLTPRSFADYLTTGHYVSGDVQERMVATAIKRMPSPVPPCAVVEREFIDGLSCEATWPHRRLAVLP